MAENPKAERKKAADENKHRGSLSESISEADRKKIDDATSSYSKNTADSISSHLTDIARNNPENLDEAIHLIGRLRDTEIERDIINASKALSGLSDLPKEEYKKALAEIERHESEGRKRLVESFSRIASREQQGEGKLRDALDAVGKYKGAFAVEAAKEIEECGSYKGSKEHYSKAVESLGSDRTAGIINNFKGEGTETAVKALVRTAARSPESLPKVAELMEKYKGEDAERVGECMVEVSVLAPDKTGKAAELIGRYKGRGAAGVAEGLKSVVQSARSAYLDRVINALGKYEVPKKSEDHTFVGYVIEEIGWIAMNRPKDLEKTLQLLEKGNSMDNMLELYHTHLSLVR